MLGLWGSKVRVRLAPSPTGSLHIGTARTALFNWLFARKQRGKFILRIEDTDQERSKKEFEEDIKDSLRWLGLSWDEEYHQSERSAVYKKYLMALLEKEKAFYCNHPSEKNSGERKPHQCDRQSKEGIIRFKNDAKEKIIFHDIIRGRVEFDPQILGDFSLAIDLEHPLFAFAGTVDDHEMRISHVIRGEDHISNTPKQVLLYQAFGWTMPLFSHIPLTLGPDRSKLSKRHGATSILEYRREGYLPEALLNFMALLGWHPVGEQEIFTREELIKEFSLERMQRGGAIFDSEKLDWINGHYIRSLSDEKLADFLLPHLISGGLIKTSFDQVQFMYTTKSRVNITKKYLIDIAKLEKERLKKLSEIGEVGSFFFERPIYSAELLSWKGKQSVNDIVTKLDNSINIMSGIKPENFGALELKDAFMPIAQKEGRGELLWPLRVALSGRDSSPGPFEIMEILGKEEAGQRIKNAIRLIHEKD